MKPLLLALLLLAQTHSEPLVPAEPSDLANRRIVHETTDEIHRTDRDVVVERRYDLADGSVVIVISRYGSGIPTPLLDSPEAWKAHAALLDQRLAWVLQELYLSRWLAQQAALQSDAREIRIVKDYWGEAVRAGLVAP
jgi:hypothetical protein